MNRRIGFTKDGETMVEVGATPHGRKIYLVPKESWLLPDAEEREVECLYCGEPIRYFTIYKDVQKTPPITHEGTCEYKLTARKEHEETLRREKLEKLEDLDDKIDRLIKGY